MLTQITGSGYKSLQKSTAKFAHFTVIVGRNNVGKSNLFDALSLLSHLAQMPIASAFKPELHRGDPLESFFSEYDLRTTIACEFDLSHTPDPFYPSRSLSHPLLNYEIEIAFRAGRLEVDSETLEGRTATAKRTRKFISPGKDRSGETRVSLSRDMAKAGKVRQFRFPSTRSILTMIDDAELYPHVVALTRELSSWRFFHFEPDALREPSPAMDVLELESSGRGLSGFYDTLKSREPERFC